MLRHHPLPHLALLHARAVLGPGPVVLLIWQIGEQVVANGGVWEASVRARRPLLLRQRRPAAQPHGVLPRRQRLQLRGAVDDVEGLLSDDLDVLGPVQVVDALLLLGEALLALNAAVAVALQQGVERALLEGDLAIAYARWWSTKQPLVNGVPLLLLVGSQLVPPRLLRRRPRRHPRRLRGAARRRRRRVPPRRGRLGPP
mmetsp:Transcript_41693/g.110721  ORF Transcript_41693/g.110721 Transcript_41693/m.110721 type:complete len:200 (-) Transcript_41693:2-601(-)